MCWCWVDLKIYTVSNRAFVQTHFPTPPTLRMGIYKPDDLNLLYPGIVLYTVSVGFFQISILMFNLASSHVYVP